MRNTPATPPRLAEQFLEWYCHPDLLEEIQGDLNEAFAERITTKGISKARLLYILDVIRFIRPFTLQRGTSPYLALHLADMLANYFKITLRNLVRYKSYSAINVSCLAMGMAVALHIGLWMWDEISSHCPVMENQHFNGGIITTEYVPAPSARNYEPCTAVTSNG